MFKNYLLLALKSFKKQKLFSLINILGYKPEQAVGYWSLA
jgi:hypothetical protein